jgi:hypothetical protein
MLFYLPFFTLYYLILWPLARCWVGFSKLPLTFKKTLGQLSLGQFYRASPSVVQDITCQPLKERMQGMAI